MDKGQLIGDLFGRKDTESSRYSTCLSTNAAVAVYNLLKWRKLDRVSEVSTMAVATILF